MHWCWPLLICYLVPGLSNTKGGTKSLSSPNDYNYVVTHPPVQSDMDAKENTEYYGTLAKEMMQETSRSSVADTTFARCTELLQEILTTPMDQLVEDSRLSLCNAVFRFLRNSCIQCRKNQDRILAGGIVQLSNGILEKLCSPATVRNAPVTELIDTKAMMLQFLGNVIVNNTNTQQFLWRNSFPALFYNIFANCHLREKDLACMILLTLFKNRDNLFNDPDEVWIMLSVLDLLISSEDSDVEWSLLLIEYIISSGQMHVLYEKLNTYDDERLHCLELLLSFLSSSESPIDVPDKTLLFVAGEWCRLSHDLEEEETERLHEISNFYRPLLDILGTATSYISRYSFHAAKTRLISQAIGNLRYFRTHEFKSRDAFLGVKSDLLRLLGNLCYKTKECQDEVRITDGIPLILECCVIDTQDPNLKQWAIFTIRNLCEDNLDNQAEIAKLETCEVLSDDWLQRQGLQVSLQGGTLRLERIKDESLRR